MKPSQFLKLLWGERPEGKILIWTLGDKRSHWISDPSEADQWDGKADVYHGLAKSAHVDRGATERVKPAESFGIPGLWIDVDYGEDHKRKNLPPTEFDAVEFIASIEIEPTVIVNSGNGRHLYWLFPEPEKLLTAETRLAAAELTEAWNRHIQHLADKRGWWVDSVYDLSRILRLPNTVNAKEPTDIKQVEVIKSDGPRHSYEWWRERISEYRRRDASEARAGVSTPEKPATPLESNRADAVGELSLDAEKPIGDWFHTMLELMPDARATYEHRKPLPSNDDSMSAYDLALASYAVAHGRSDQDIADMIIYHRRTKGDADDLEKGARVDYVQRTIVRARNGNTDAPVTKEQIEEKPIKDVLDQLGVSVKRIVKLVDDHGDAGRYRLETPDGNIEMGGIDTITSESKWRNIIADATQVLPKRVPRGTWDSMAQRLLDIVVTLRPGDPGHPQTQTEVVETVEWLRDYFNTHGFAVIDDGSVVVDGEQSEEDIGVVIERRIPFQITGERHIFIDHLIKWVDANRGVRLMQRIMGSRLRDAGMENGRTYLGGARVTTWFISDRDWSEIAF